MAGWIAGALSSEWIYWLCRGARTRRGGVLGRAPFALHAAHSTAAEPEPERCSCCMLRAVAAGEYISVASQRDTEAADVEKERLEQVGGVQCWSPQAGDLCTQQLPRKSRARACRARAVRIDTRRRRGQRPERTSWTS